MTSSSDRPPTDGLDDLSHEAAWLVWNHFLAVVSYTAKSTDAGLVAMDTARDALVAYLNKLEANSPRLTEQK